METSNPNVNISFSMIYVNCVHYCPNTAECEHRKGPKIFWIVKDICPVAQDARYECELREKFSWSEENLIS